MGRFNQIAYAVIATLISTTALFSANASASGCSAEITRDTNGKFAACIVTVGGKEFRMGADRSSEGGCSQVCSIMGAVETSKKGGRIATAMNE
jgi:hypothetical protein